MGCGWWCVMLLVALLVCVLLGSCKTVKEKDIERVAVHDTVRMVTVRKDSVVRYDSVFVNQYTKGDTVYRDRDVIRYAYVDRVRVDTLWQVKDSVVYRDKEVEVKAQLTLWERWRGYVGWMLLGVVVAMEVGRRVRAKV